MFCTREMCVCVCVRAKEIRIHCAIVISVKTTSIFFSLLLKSRYELNEMCFFLLKLRKKKTECLVCETLRKSLMFEVNVICLFNK